MSETYEIRLQAVTEKAIKAIFAEYKNGEFNSFQDYWVPKSQITEGLDDIPGVHEVRSSMEVYEIELSDWFEDKIGVAGNTGAMPTAHEEAPF